MNIRVALFSVVLLVLGFVAHAKTVLSPEEHIRPEDQTYLTFPEWYLVHSPAEYADFLEHQPSHLFTYWGHINQFWESYGAVNDAIADSDQSNVGYHIMIGVIGTSTTVEYAVKSHYEKTIGRITALGQEKPNTLEDQLAARVARDYVNFIRIDPWYKFDFWGPLKEVWTDTGWKGEHKFRKWERKYALTTEYLITGIYAWMIGKATATGYEAPIPFTSVAASGGTPELYAKHADVLENNVGPHDRSLLLLPRYQAFTTEAVALASHGVTFHEIAGNQEKILLSVLSTEALPALTQETVILLTQPLLTQHPRMRYLLQVPIVKLGQEIRLLDAAGVEIEHIYDF